MDRRIIRHATRLSAALDPGFQPGQRVLTLEGATGRVLFIEQSFSPGAETYVIQLDHGGTGSYLASQLRPAPEALGGGHQAPAYLPAGVTAALEAEAELERTAADDYPEMGSVLHERPDPGRQISVIGSRTAAVQGHGLDPFAMAMHGLSGDDAEYMRAVIEHIRERKGPGVPIDKGDAELMARSMRARDRMEQAGYQISAHSRDSRFPRGIGIDIHHNHRLHLVPERYDGETNWYARIVHAPHLMGPKIEHTIRTSDEDLPSAVRTFLDHPDIQREMEHQRAEGQRIHEEIRREGHLMDWDGPEADDSDPDEHNATWCHVCAEHHEDPEEAEEHDSSYTDWDEVYPTLGSHVHRGMALEFGPLDHRAIHDHSQPLARRAEALRQAVEHSHGLGTSWTSTADQAHHYTEVSAHQRTGRGYSHRDPSITQVIFHAQTPAREHIETDPYTLSDRNVLGYDRHEDNEIPLRDGAPLSLTGVSWKRHDEDGYHHYDFDGHQGHLASVYADGYDERDQDYNGAEPVGGIYWQAPAEQKFVHQEGLDEPEQVPAPAMPVQQMIATTINGTQIDDHGDAPEHGTIPRAQEPNSYDGRSTEGQGDPVWSAATPYDGMSAAEVKKRHNGAQIGMYPEGVTNGGGAGPGLEIGAFVAHLELVGPYEEPPLSSPLHQHIRAVHQVADDQARSEMSHSGLATPAYHDLLHDADEGYGTDWRSGARPHERGDLRVQASSREDKSDRWWEYQNRSMPDTIHRGIHVELPGDLHEYIHDESQPAADRAHALASHFQGSGLGVHWTPHISIAHRSVNNAASGNTLGGSYHGGGDDDWYDDDEDYGYGDDEGAEPRKTDIIFHARKPGKRNELRNPELLSQYSVGWQYGKGEDEFPLRHGSPVKLQGISWKLHEPEYPNEPYEHVDFAKPMRHVARVPWTGHQRTELHDWQQVGGATEGDFVPSSQYTNRHPIPQPGDELMDEGQITAEASYWEPDEEWHAEHFGPHGTDDREHRGFEPSQEFGEYDPDDWTSIATEDEHRHPDWQDERRPREQILHTLSSRPGSLASEVIAGRHSMPEDTPEGRHLMDSHGWDEDAIHRTVNRGNRLDDMHDALHAAGLANHTHEHPDIEDEPHADPAGRFGFEMHPQHIEHYTEPGRGGQAFRDPADALSSSEPKHFDWSRIPRQVWSSLAPEAVGPRAYLEHVAGTDKAAAVYEQLLDDYPEDAIGWVREAAWEGPRWIPFDQVEWEGRKQWTAYHQPDKVRKFARKGAEKEAEGGHLKPSVTVRTPGAARIMVPDGHHRAASYLLRAAEGQRVPGIWAWVGSVDEETGPWDEMHDRQLHAKSSKDPQDDTADDDDVQGTPAERRSFQQQIERGVREFASSREPALPGGREAAPADQSLLTAQTQLAQPLVKLPAMSQGRRKSALQALARAAGDASFRFEFTASWHDVQAKAARMRREGKVTITHVSKSIIIGEVIGDHATYESGVQRYPGRSQGVMAWICGCPWASFHQNQERGITRFAGRMCSHAYAIHLEASSRAVTNPYGTGVRPDVKPWKFQEHDVVVKSWPPYEGEPHRGRWRQEWLAPAASKTASFITMDQARQRYRQEGCYYHHSGPCPSLDEDMQHEAAVYPGGLSLNIRELSLPERHAYAQKESGRVPTHILTAAGADNRRLGYLHFSTSDDGRAHEVIMLHTRPEAEGHGVASAMMDHLYAHARANGAWINHGFRTQQGAGWWQRYREPHPELNVHNHRPDAWNRYFNPAEVASDMHDNWSTSPGGNHPRPPRGRNMLRNWDYEPTNAQWRKADSVVSTVMPDFEPAPAHQAARILLATGEDPETVGKLMMLAGLADSQALIRRHLETAHSPEIGKVMPQGMDAVGYHGKLHEIGAAMAIPHRHENQQPSGPQDPQLRLLQQAAADPYAMMRRHIQAAHGIGPDEAYGQLGVSPIRYHNKLHEMGVEPEVPHEHDRLDPDPYHPLTKRADQANAPWGVGAEHPAPPGKPYGATSPPEKDRDPGSYGPLAGPDPDNWGEIQDGSFVQQPLSNTAAFGGPDTLDWIPEHQEGFPYSDQANTSGPSTSISPGDPQGLNVDAARKLPPYGSPELEEMERDWRVRHMDEQGHDEAHLTGTHHIPPERLPADRRDWPGAHYMLHGQGSTGFDSYAMEHFPEQVYLARNFAGRADPHEHTTGMDSPAETARRQMLAGMTDAQRARWYEQNNPFGRSGSLGEPQLDGALAELKDEPEGALDPEGLTGASDGTIGGGSSGAGGPDDWGAASPALLSSWGNRLRTVREAAGGYSPAGDQPASMAQHPDETTTQAPGMGSWDEPSAPADSSIQTIGTSSIPIRDVQHPDMQVMGTQQWSGGGSDSDEIAVEPEMAQGTLDDIVASFQRSAAASQYAGGGGPAGNGDIAAAARAFLQKTADVLPPEEADELIREGRGTRARNLDLLRLEGTHYVDDPRLDDAEDDVIYA